jgi:hypothetical protein
MRFLSLADHGHFRPLLRIGHTVRCGLRHRGSITCYTPSTIQEAKTASCRCCTSRCHFQPMLTPRFRITCSVNFKRKRVGVAFVTTKIDKSNAIPFDINDGQCEQSGKKPPKPNICDISLPDFLSRAERPHSCPHSPQSSNR